MPIDRQQDEAHLWLALCEPPPHDVGRFESMLPEDDRNRARRFASPELREQFIVQRATLRCVLAAYLDQAPADIRIVAEPQGKPALADATSDLTYNLSHSGRWLLIGIARGRSIGVDVQIERCNTRCVDLARRFFAPEEAGMLARLDPHEQVHRFFTLWTLKEAHLKATGEGIAGGLHRVRPQVREHGAAVLLIDDDPHAAARWHAHSLDVDEGYAAAVVIERNRSAPRMRFGRWELGGPPPHAGLLGERFR